MMLDPDEYPYVIKTYDVLNAGTEVEELIEFTSPQQFKQREEVLNEAKIWAGHGKTVRLWKIQAVSIEEY